MRTLAVHGRVVSPVSRYVSAAPGERPAVAEVGLSDGGSGTCCDVERTGRSLPTGHGRGAPGPDPRQALLEQRVREALDACGGQGVGVHVTLESTRQEIVEVGDVTLRGPADPVLDTCVREGVWGIELPEIFGAFWRRWEIELRS